MPRANSLTTEQTTKEKTMSKIVPRGGALVAAAQMKHLALAASVIAALALSSVALAGGTLAGKYTTTIKSPAQLKGTWVLNLAKGGTYTVVDNGQLLVRGKYSTTESKITFGHEAGNGACAKSGTYTWKKTGKTLKFTRVRDSLACGRPAVLAHTFTEQR
jgi:hypothetical protein